MSTEFSKNYYHVLMRHLQMRIDSKLLTFYSLCVATITKGWDGGGGGVRIGFGGRGGGADRIRQ